MDPIESKNDVYKNMTIKDLQIQLPKVNQKFNFF